MVGPLNLNFHRPVKPNLILHCLYSMKKKKQNTHVTCIRYGSDLFLTYIIYYFNDEPNAYRRRKIVQQ